jgi:hypothetical protein
VVHTETRPYKEEQEGAGRSRKEQEGAGRRSRKEEQEGGAGRRSRKEEQQGGAARRSSKVQRGRFGDVLARARAESDGVCRVAA